MSVDAGFCNDRSVASTANIWDPYDTALGYGRNETYYGKGQTQFVCPQTNDLFTTSTNSKGNKALTYPVGLITLDEVVYAGGTYHNANATYYLNNSTEYWTMSPCRFVGDMAYVGYVVGSGSMNFDFSGYVIGVRATVNLSSYVEITSGDGTIDNPYIVK